VIAISARWRRRLPLLAAAALFAFGNLVFFLSYRSTFHDRRIALEARRDDLKRSVEAREAEAARLAGQRERLNGVSTAIEEFYGKRIGPQRESLAAIVAEVHNVLQGAGVSTAQIAYTTTGMQKLPLTQMRIVFSVRCDYARFKRLLRAFETDKRWIAVRSVSINRDNDQPGSVQVQLELATYFRESDASPPAPQKSAGAPAAARRAG
jgi:Tfp pilus assembly protein PilO